MIKTVTVASVLAAASVVQADILFDSTSTFNQVSVQSSPAAQVIGGSILTDLGNDRPYGEYPQYTITGAGSLSFVAGTSPDMLCSRCTRMMLSMQWVMPFTWDLVIVSMIPRSHSLHIKRVKKA